MHNRTPHSKELQILECLHDFSKRYSDIADEMQVSKSVVERLASQLSPEVRKERYSKINHYAKLGPKNHMTGKIQDKHPNAKDIVYVAGYKTVWAPNWWEGLMPKGNRVYEHQLNWAKAAKATKVPEGCVIHHIDEDKDNNHPDNLVCLTRRQHAQLHCVTNLLSKCNDYPKGVEGSALEAQRHLLAKGV
jgi:hypothetical protein